MDQNLIYDVGFSYMLGIGPLTYDLLVQHFTSAKLAYTASRSDLREQLGDVLTEKFITFRNTFDPEKEISLLKKKRVTILTRESSRFPESLRQISDTPICLYVKGDIQAFDFSKHNFFGIVGTRKPTSYGIQVATKFSRELSEAGFVIVSGLALGIDTIAHITTLEAKGKTIAFLGCGVNIIYPPANRDLYERMLKDGSLIISEFPPDMLVKPGLFVARNRLISGISKGVLIAEGLKGSGSLITAKYALEQGREVFAPPAPITSDQSQAPNLLIKQGAKLVTSVEDVLEEFSMSPSSQKIFYDFTPEESEVYEVLKNETLDSDGLSRYLKKPVFQILSVLSTLEISGLIEKDSMGKYFIKL